MKLNRKTIQVTTYNLIQQEFHEQYIPFKEILKTFTIPLTQHISIFHKFHWSTLLQNFPGT